MLEWLTALPGNVVTVATALVTVLVAFLIARYGLIPFYAARRRDRILDTRNWSRMIAGLNPGWAELYYTGIAASRGWFDRVYGPRLWSWRAFDRALLFAFVYAIFSLMIGWVAFDTGHLGGVPFLAEGLPPWQRTAMLTAVLVGARLVYAVGLFGFSIQAWLATRFRLWPAMTRWTKRRLSLSEGGLAEIAHWLLISLAVAVAVFGTIVFEIVGSGGGAIAFALVLAGAAAGVDAAITTVALLLGVRFGVGTVVVSSAILVGGTLLAASSVNPSESVPFLELRSLNLTDFQFLVTIIFFLFFVVLPLLNAIADLLSVAATRYFLRRIDTGRLGAWGVLAGLVFDIVIALGCLSLLLWLITQTLDLWAQLAPVTLPFD